MSTRDGYEPLVWTHLRAMEALGFGGWSAWSDARLRFLPMVGYAYFSGGEIVGAGGVVFQGSFAEGCFALRPDFASSLRSRWVHRAAVEVLSVAHRAAPVIHARVDESIPAARRWMVRLGFEPPADGEYWTHVVRGSRSDISRFVHRQQFHDDRDAGRDGVQCVRADSGGQS